MGTEHTPAPITTAAAKPAAVAAQPSKQADVPILVRAIRRGTYPDPGQLQARMRQIGDEFTVSCERHFSSEWMEKITAENRHHKPIDPAKPPEGIQLMSIANRVRDPLKFQ